MTGSYRGFAQELLVDFIGGKTVKALLVSSDYVPSTGHTWVADVAGFELANGGYARRTVTGVSVIATTEGEAALVADDVAFGPLGAEVTDVGGVIFFVDTGNPNTSLLLAHDIEGPFDPPAGTLHYLIDPVGGLVTVQV